MDCAQFKSSPRSKCTICGKTLEKHPKPDPVPVEAVLPAEPVETISDPNPRFRASQKFKKASNEILLNEILNLVFPKGEIVKNSEVLMLRLSLIPGILEKYGFGHQFQP